MSFQIEVGFEQSNKERQNKTVYIVPNFMTYWDLVPVSTQQK